MSQEVSPNAAQKVPNPTPVKEEITPEVENEVLGKFNTLTLKPHSHRFFGKSRYEDLTLRDRLFTTNTANMTYARRRLTFERSSRVKASLMSSQLFQ